MSSETNQNRQELAEIEGCTLAAALSGMTVDQLVELRATARRLQHLPFPRLVNALFNQELEESASGRQKSATAARLCEEATVTYGTPQPSPSKFMDELFAQIERILAARATG